MVEKVIKSSQNVVDLAGYRERNGGARAVPALTCRHCGAALHEGEREEECSSAFNVDDARLRWQAAQILRGADLNGLDAAIHHWDEPPGGALHQSIGRQ